MSAICAVEPVIGSAHVRKTFEFYCAEVMVFPNIRVFLPRSLLICTKLMALAQDYKSPAIPFDSLPSFVNRLVSILHIIIKDIQG